ncbi:hypothetical protein FHG89_27335 [Micromonospora orduensis]|uniref:Uncharacterized protein n=1 Tax=Micromonospora orduensis TaxID=1420891 RepID=A0A5C4QE91_9ACTN|nr:hypothetical protein [Micromonospora orduensis]TNH23307.1 hypothetical protein FHG89_27335 [Micromonospora orduensis]
MHNLPTPPVSEHPAWCDKQDCERRAEHRSPAMNVDTNRPEAAIVDVALTQALHPLAEPAVSMTVIEGQAAQHIALSIGQARVLRYRLANLIDAAKGGQR